MVCGGVNRMYVLDTCICAEFLRGRLPETFKSFKRSSPAVFKIPAVVLAELKFGVEISARVEENRLETALFVLPFEVFPFDARCSSEYAKIRAHLKRAGKTIGPNDLLIAATALAHDATLVTLNDREFKRVPGLRIEYWDEIDPAKV